MYKNNAIFMGILNKSIFNEHKTTIIKDTRLLLVRL